MHIPCYLDYSNAGGTQDAAVYDKYRYKAWHYMCSVTAGRVTEATEESAIMQCMVDLIDAYIRVDDIRQALQQGRVTSESIGDYSAHFTGYSSADLKDAQDQPARIVRQWLWMYIYRGCAYV